MGATLRFWEFPTHWIFCTTNLQQVGKSLHWNFHNLILILDLRNLDVLLHCLYHRNVDLLLHRHLHHLIFILHLTGQQKQEINRLQKTHFLLGRTIITQFISVYFSPNKSEFNPFAPQKNLLSLQPAYPIQVLQVFLTEKLPPRSFFHRQFAPEKLPYLAVLDT